MMNRHWPLFVMRPKQIVRTLPLFLRGVEPVVHRQMGEAFSPLSWTVCPHASTTPSFAVCAALWNPVSYISRLGEPRLERDADHLFLRLGGTAVRCGTGLAIQPRARDDAYVLANFPCNDVLDIELTA